MFDISKLKNGICDSLNINEAFEFKDEDLKGTDIKKLENIKANGKITRIETNTYRIELNITGDMTLLCARSLEEVIYPLNIFIDNNISEEQTEEKPLILQNSLDIFSIVWENIVLEVPLRIIKEDAQFISSGDGWSLISEDEVKNASPFSELKSMLDMEGKE